MRARFLGSCRSICRRGASFRCALSPRRVVHVVASASRRVQRRRTPARTAPSAAGSIPYLRVRAKQPRCASTGPNRLGCYGSRRHSSALDMRRTGTSRSPATSNTRASVRRRPTATASGSLPRKPCEGSGVTFDPAAPPAQDDGEACDRPRASTASAPTPWTRGRARVPRPVTAQHPAVALDGRRGVGPLIRGQRPGAARHRPIGAEDDPELRHRARPLPGGDGGAGVGDHTVATPEPAPARPARHSHVPPWRVLLRGPRPRRRDRAASPPGPARRTDGVGHTSAAAARRVPGVRRGAERSVGRGATSHRGRLRPRGANGGATISPTRTSYLVGRKSGAASTRGCRHRRWPRRSSRAAEQGRRRYRAASRRRTAPAAPSRQTGRRCSYSRRRPTVGSTSCVPARRHRRCCSPRRPPG